MSSHAERLHDAPRGPLTDLRVLELGTLIAGPFAGRWLADFGADVIKIEHPAAGDPLRQWGKTVDGTVSLWHLVQSRGKRSVAADLNRAEDQDLVRRLALESDILIENFRPGRLEAWNLSPAELIEANPRLIVVRISAYGQTGPLRDQPGFGTIAEAAAGLRYITGDPDRPPARVGLSLGDSIASMHALVGALMAIHERERSGHGQLIDVSLTESLFTMLEAILPEYGWDGEVRQRTGNIAHNSAPTNSYPCLDGSLVCIAANTSSLFRTLFREIGRDDLADDPELASNEGRVARAAELDEAIASWTEQRPAEEAILRLRERQIPVSRINSIADIVADPQFQARDMIVAVDDPRFERPLLVPGISPKLSRTPGRVPALARDLGADTDAVRAGIGRPASGSSGPAGPATSTTGAGSRPAVGASGTHGG